MQALLTAIRQACSPQTWSQGVELSRAGAVVGERQTDDEVELRVATDGGMQSRLVLLYPDDADWSCECPSREDACVHVAAAAIALSRARSEGKRMPTSSTPLGKLRYAFERTAEGLTFERHIVTGKDSKLLVSTLASAVGKQTGAPSLVATQADLNLEMLLGTRPRGVLAREHLAKVLPALNDVELTLDNKPVKIGQPTSGMQVVIEDCAEGFRARLEQDPRVDEIFRNGVIRQGNELCAIQDSGLSVRDVEDLRRGRIFRAEHVPELLTSFLPMLKKHLTVCVLAKLPETGQARPRLVVNVEDGAEGLSVLATLVYGDPPVARVDGEHLHHLGGAIPLRDRRLEQALVRRLQSELGLAPGERRYLLPKEAPSFAARLATFNAQVLGPEKLPFRLAGALVPRLRVGSKGDRTDFDLSFGAPDNASGVSAAQVLDAYERGLTLLPLGDGGVAPLPLDWLAQHAQRVLDLLAAKDAREGLPNSAVPDLARLCEALEEPAPPSFTKLKHLVDNFAGIPHTTLPSDVKAELRDYQKRGVDWLAFLKGAGLGGLLADDMGLGKTLQALCALVPRALVVAPTSVMANWQAEIAKFRPGLRVNVYHGAKRDIAAPADVVLTTYAILRLDIDRLAQEHFATVILDEAQAIKNPDSQVARAAFRLNADFRLTLSGTPVENRLDELWSQLHFTNPGLLGGRQDFSSRYVRPIENGDTAVAEYLRARVKPFVLRRRKQEVAPELPPRTEVVLRCELSTDERAVYDTVRAATLDSVVGQLEAGGSVIAALEALLRLRQASCHPALVPGQKAEVSAKVSLLLETLEEALAEGHKALVFSQWTSLLDLVEPHLQAAHMKYVRLDGATRDRGAVVEEFQRDDGPPVMLISLKAGGTGLNLTAADHVFLLDPWWNPAVEDQAADRAHRIGQERPVIIHRLIAQDTVEERILLLQDKKRALADMALGDAAGAVSLDRSELLDLLRA